MAKLRQLVLIFALLGLAFSSPIQEDPEEQLAGEDTTSGPAQTDICKGQNDGSLLTDPTCKECFYECNNHLAYRFHCPPALIFSPSGPHAGCIPDPSAPTVVIPCTGGSHFDCKGKADGFYADATSTNKFHECVHGCGADFDCPPTTAWDSSRNVCAFDTNAPHPTAGPPVTQPPVTPAPTQPHHEDTTPTHFIPQDTTPTHWFPHEDTTAPTQVHHEETTPTPAIHEETTPTHWTPAPWTPEHVTDPVTQHHEDTTQPPVHHEETTQPPVTQPPVTPPTNEQSTRGRHTDP